MQEIKKRRIVLASTLKPVTDSRMFHKLALSLVATHEVHVIGSGALENNFREGVFLHPVGNFSRLSIRRLLMPWTIFSMVRALNPDVLIICTHELLVPAVLLRILSRARIIYDVQENYFRNILYTAAFPTALRYPLAFWVRLKERLTFPFIEKYLLAERGYAHEMPFTVAKAVALENKFKGVRLPTTPVRPRKKLLFTGTLSETTGVFVAIRLAKKLHAEDPAFHLDIAGYCSRPRELSRIREEIRGSTFITLHGGDRFLPHEEITGFIRGAGFGIIAYPPNPSTENCIPTKLYEYLANLLPVLLTDHPLWVEKASRYGGCIRFSPGAIDAQAILAQIETGTFYTRQPDDVFWESEAPKLLSCI